MKIDAMRQHYQTLLGDIPEDEMNAKINKELALYEMVGSEIPYRTETTNSDYKYNTMENRDFAAFTKKQKKQRILRLWRQLFNKTRGCNVVISQFGAINTKLAYFGRQLLAYDQIEQKNKEMAIKSKKTQSVCLFNPDGLFKKLWDVGIIIILLYTATYAPFKTAFLEDEDSSKAVLAFEFVVDSMFLIDIVFTFMTPYRRLNGSLETRFKKIALNYISGAFWIDMIASFPT